MKTTDILLAVKKTILQRYQNEFPITYVFDDWSNVFNKFKDEIYRLVSIELGQQVHDIKNDALRIIMNKLFLESLENGENPWNREYVRKKYESNISGCDVIYFPAKRAKRLVVNFSSMGKDRYDRYSRYWDQTEKWDSDTAHVFFKDDAYTYYLGHETAPLSGVYFKLIKSFYQMNELDSSNVFTVGGSMGGYAALYYAIALELNGAIVVSPQTTYKATLAHMYRNWEKHIRALGSQWVDLDMMFHRIEKCPNLYIEYGHYPADVLAVESVINEVKKKKESFIIERRTNWKEHTVDSCLSKETVESMITIFEEHGFVFNDASVYSS